MTAGRATASIDNADLAGDYARDGYVVLRSCLDARTVSALAAEADRLYACRDLIRADNLRTELCPTPRGEDINKFDPVIDLSPQFAALATDERLLSPLANVLGEPVRLFKDKLIYKLPGHAGFGAHQDNTWYWPFPASIVTAMVCIDTADTANGTLEVAPGWHTLPNPVPPGELRNLSDHEVPATAWQALDLQAGDAVLFSCLLPHRSGPNVSTQARRVIHLSFNPASAGDLYLAHYRHRRDFLCRDNVESLGNFYVPAACRAQATYDPPIPGL